MTDNFSQVKKGILDEIDHAHSHSSVRDFNRCAALFVSRAGSAKHVRQSQGRQEGMQAGFKIRLLLDSLTAAAGSQGREYMSARWWLAYAPGRKPLTRNPCWTSPYDEAANHRLGALVKKP